MQNIKTVTQDRLLTNFTLCCFKTKHLEYYSDSSMHLEHSGDLVVCWITFFEFFIHNSDGYIFSSLVIFNITG